MIKITDMQNDHTDITSDAIHDVPPTPAPIASVCEHGAHRAGMGPFELKAYKACRSEAKAYRAFVTDIATDRAMYPDNRLPEKTKSGFSAMRRSVIGDIDDDDDDDRKNSRIVGTKDAALAVNAGDVAARLLLAKLIDEQAGLSTDLREGAPTVVIDVTDDEMFAAILKSWKKILFDPKRVAKVSSTARRDREDEAVYLVVKDPLKGTHRADVEAASLSALTLGLPFLAFSPIGEGHLPVVVLKAATYRIEVPPLDPITVSRVIRIVTGRRCGESIDAHTAATSSISDLIIAVRVDRTPAACVAELRRLADARDAKKSSRDLTLDQLHGLGEAREWAKSAIADIKAWKAGEIGWSSVSSAVALTGLPGTGKTTFAKVFAAEANLHLITASLAKWQASGEGHLGHLLRAMRQDFADARARSPSVLFIDEVDAFPDRASLTHSHKDYVIQTVNSLLELVDGITGREGVVVIGASNDLSRCDPALLRSGRLDRVVHIGLPDAGDLEKMLRVRLGRDLQDVPLGPFVELAMGMTGADVERVVKDARRAARRSGRPLIEADLRGAITTEDTRPAELRWRTCVHEAGHIVTDVLHFGADDVFATSAASGSRGGMSIRTRQAMMSGTYENYHKRIQIFLAGRVAEEILLSGGADGAGGRTESDLDQATKIAAAMIGSVGLAGPTPLVYRGNVQETSELMAFSDVRIAVDKELRKAAEDCRALLQNHVGALRAVAKVLYERTRIDGTETADFIRSYQTGTSHSEEGPARDDGDDDGRVSFGNADRHRNS